MAASSIGSSLRWYARRWPRALP